VKGVRHARTAFANRATFTETREASASLRVVDVASSDLAFVGRESCQDFGLLTLRAEPEKEKAELEEQEDEEDEDELEPMERPKQTAQR
jgi:hypothetical protein